MNQINGCGERAVKPYDGLSYWDYKLAQGRRRLAHDRNLQTGRILSAGILRLRLFAAGHQPASPRETGRKSIELGTQFYRIVDRT